MINKEINYIKTRLRVLFLAIFFISINNCNPASNSDITLVTGRIIEKELKINEKLHAYFVTMKSDDYLDLIVEQEGVDVILTFIGPKENIINKIDRSIGKRGLERLKIIVPDEGKYRLEITSSDPTVQGQYKIKNILQKPSNNDVKMLVEVSQNEIKIEELFANGELEKALNLAETGLAIRERLLSPEHPDIAQSLDDIAVMCEKKGEYDKSEKHHTKALTIRRKTLGEDPETARSLSNFAELYRLMGKYDESENLQQEALVMREKLLGLDHLDTIYSLHGLAAIYQIKGKFHEAEELYKKAINPKISEKLSKVAPMVVATCFTDLGTLYDDRGEYDKAVPLHKQAIETYKKVENPYLLMTAILLNNLARSYQSLGDNKQSIPLFDEAAQIAEKYISKKDRNDAEAIMASGLLRNMAYVYQNNQQYNKAQDIYIKILPIYKNILGEHRETANTIDNFASLCEYKNQYKEAEKLQRIAFAIREKVFGLYHPDTAISLSNLGTNCYSQGKYKEAEKYLIKALEVRKKILDPEHPDLAFSLNLLSLYYTAKGKFDEAIKYKEQADESREKDLSRKLSYGSESQKLSVLNLTSGEFDESISLHLKASPNKVAGRLALTAILRRKGRALDAMSNVIASLRNQAKPQDQKLFDEISSSKAYLSYLISTKINKEKTDTQSEKIKEVTRKIENLEAQLNERVLEFQIQNQPITLEVVQKAIPPDSKLIEFITYNVVDSKTLAAGEKHYAVYVLDSTGELQWADLGKVEIIDELIRKFRDLLQNPESNLEKEFKPIAQTLYNKVVQPISKYLNKEQRLLICPDGQLNLIPFGAMIDEESKYLVEKHPINYLTSGRDLLRLKVPEKNKEPEPALIIGDPDYGIGQGPSLVGDQLPRLEGTGIEAQKLKEIFTDAKLAIGKEATEELVKKTYNPKILHIGTHGLFLEYTRNNTTKNKDSRLIQVSGLEVGTKNLINLKAENPLLRSCLFFAGVNKNEQNNGDDGILTALEVTSLNLFATKLVVLSACKTGLGDVKNGDGVYGLRRALVLAGSETQIISLWAVKDKVNPNLMIKYYKLLKEGVGRGEALRQVQLSFINSKNGTLEKPTGQNINYQHPYYWAVFIQSGEWANLAGNR